MEKKTINLLWHWENQRDYSRLPSFDRERYPDLRPAEFNRMPDQCKAYELWRRNQPREYRLRIYQTHFPGFIPPPFDDPFFDYHCNLHKRRHQAFLDSYYEGKTAVMFSPGLIPAEDFEIESAIERAESGKRLVILTDAAGEQALVWILPADFLKLFAQPISAELMDRCDWDDLTYWFSLAGLLAPPLFRPWQGLTDYLPKYSRIPEGRAPLSGIGRADPAPADTCEAWSDRQFDEWIGRQTFIFAKTMRGCPHEYIYIWKRSYEERKNYLRAIDYMHRNAHIDVWHNRYQAALLRDGHKYGYCGTIDLLNRTSRELQRKIFLEDGKDENGRPLK